MASFLMVCLGNICRSPLAEAILRQKADEAGLDWKVDSAGTNGFHVGEAPHPLSRKVARMNGIDLSRQRARKFTAEDFRRFDKIYAMAGDVVEEMRRIAGRQFDASKVDLLMNEVTPGRNQDVPDPWSGPESGYQEVYRMIDAAAEKIVSAARSLPLPPAPRPPKGGVIIPEDFKKEQRTDMNETNQHNSELPDSQEDSPNSSSRRQGSINTPSRGQGGIRASAGKPSLPQGTRDFGADTVRKRNFIFSTIRTVFEVYGYQPLETPAMEQLETLMGKYGDEGDKLIFKILNNGLGDPRNIDKAKVAFEKVLQGKNDAALTERALRYDLTIPFARYVAMNHGQLSFPFKRYQIQPVWRADRPQKGRYREFYQCDADVVGSHSLINEVELAAIYGTVFNRLGLGVDIRINNRKILAALAEICGGADKMTELTVAIDKLDKIGLDKVKEELALRELTPAQIGIIEKYLSLDGGSRDKLEKLKTLFAGNETGLKGIGELEYLLDYSQAQELHSLSIDLTLARGLNYYTGTIFEVKANDVQMGSIGGGGRYDDLTGLFGVPGIPGVGISFGVDRIYDVMEELKLFPADVHTGTQVLFFHLGEAESRTAFGLMQQLRDKGVRCELYPEQAKFDKQFKYAEKKNIRYAVMIGSQELATKTCTIKDLSLRSQATCTFEELLAKTDF